VQINKFKFQFKIFNIFRSNNNQTILCCCVFIFRYRTTYTCHLL